MRLTPNWLLTTICVAGCTCPAAAVDQETVRGLLEQTGISKGICAVPGCGNGDLALEIVRQSEFYVHAFDKDRDGINEAIDRAPRANMLRDRVAFEHLVCNELPYADNFLDLVVLATPEEAGRAAEVARVVRPLGCVLAHRNRETIAALERIGFQVDDAGGSWKLARKPVAVGVDDWPHWSHGPDNNPVSRDRVIKSPYSTQWVAEPYYHAMPVVTTAAAGRVFIATGHIAHHTREIPTLNTLVARNGYNGRVLWHGKLPEGFLVHRSAFIATTDVFFLLDGSGVLKLDPETGAEIGRLELSGIQGTLMWMAQVGDQLFVLAGKNDPPTRIMSVRADWRGWGWSNVDKNYSPKGRHQIRWGFGDTLAAFNISNGDLAWKHVESGIDSRGMGILGDTLFYYVPAKKLACLDRHTGDVVWVNEQADRLALIEEEARGLVGTPGFRTTAMLLPTPEGVFVQGQKRMNVVAFGVQDGRFLWAKKKFHNNPNMLYVNNQLFISGLEENGAVRAIDPASGDTIEDLNFWKGSCTRLTGSPFGLYCRGEGLGHYDFEKKRYWAERTARPGCNDGAIPANGMLYVGPWLCDCNLSILGQMALGPAGDFDPHSQSLSGDHLQSMDIEPSSNPIRIDARDWPTYRATFERPSSSEAFLPAEASVLWKCPPRTDQAKQAQVVAVGDRMFSAGDDGIVRCLDADDGGEKWWFAAGGPIQASPTIWEGRVFVGSGDGYVYCLDVASGKLLWRFRVAPVERRIMLYGNLASVWPVNSGVVVRNGIAYAAAGLIFRDGTHVVALDAESGRLLWHNGSVGKPLNQQFELQAASAMGSLAIGGNRLWLASGNVVAPVSFDLQTGEARIVPAQRVPEWNTVMAQKPEPSGRDVMVFRDRFLMHGGRLLYSGQGHVVSAGQVNFRVIDSEGNFQGPAFTPVRHCAIPPAWDDELFVTPTSRYGDLVTWRVKEIEKRIGEAFALMIKLDEKVPGDSPEKWGKYNLIGQVFGAVERDLRASSAWAVIRDHVYGLAVTANAVVITARANNAPNGPYFVASQDKLDGRVLWKVELPSEPSLGGLSVNRDGKVLVTLCDGTVIGVGK